MKGLQSNNDQIKKILKQTEIKFGRGTAKNWRNKDFEELSFEINLNAKILISPATLKRLFGKIKTSLRYNPQESTIEALKIYSGYIDKHLENRKFGFKYIYLLILVPILIGFFVLRSVNKNENIGECDLKLMKVEGQGPATAFFNYTIPDIKDSIFLDYGDATQWAHIKRNKSSRSHFYGIPGVFKASIRTRNKRLSKVVNVFVPTSGWKALAYYFDEKSVHRYYPVPLEGNIKDGSFHPSRKGLAGIGLDSTKIVTVKLDNYRDTQLSGDTFTLKSQFKNSSFWPGIRCYSVYYTVQGTEGKIMFKFVGEGCSGYGEYVLSEKSASGSGDDLSGFAVNLNDWNQVKIINQNKHILVTIADKVVYQNHYQLSIGNILGTSIQFHGSGSVDFIQVQDSLGGNIFIEDFSN